jgi:HAD superfamily hydrolase (TIGR01490 family)
MQCFRGNVVSANVHIFDVDYTLLRRSSSYYFLLRAVQEGVLSFRQLKNLPIEWLRYKFGLIHQDFIEQAVRHLSGIDKQTIDSLASDCFEFSIKRNLYTEAADLITEIQNKGEKVLLATSSFQSVIEPIERFLGISESIASILEFADGKTTGRTVGKALFGPEKKRAVTAWLDAHSISPSDLWFYSDSYTDLPLLEIAGHPVAVNPDRFLKKQAIGRGWTIMRFKKTLGTP